MKKDDLIALVQTSGKDEARLSLLFRHGLAGKAKLHPTDLECLDIIMGGEQVTPGFLARQTGLTTGAMTAALGRLEKNKLITRRRASADRRKVIVAPVLKNMDEIFKLYRPFVQRATKLIEQYSIAELQVINRHYRAMAAIYEEEIRYNQDK